MKTRIDHNGTIETAYDDAAIEQTHTEPTPKTSPDKEIATMYQDKAPIREIKAASGLTRKMIYKRLRANGVEPNRKTSPIWTETEEAQLIEARAANVTGRELCDHIPTRTLADIKGHINKLRRTTHGEFR